MSSQGKTSLVEDLYPGYLDHLIGGDRRSCRCVVEKLLDENVNLQLIYEQLFRKSLYRVGDLWERHRLSVATEHLATATTEYLMGLTYANLFDRDPIHKTAVVACTANEHHQVGGKMVADVFELHGWDSYFLGANTPLRDLLQMVDEKQPDVIALSISVYFSMPGLVDAVNALRKEHPEIPVLVGGQAFRWGGSDLFAQEKTVSVVSTLEQLETYIQEWDA